MAIAICTKYTGPTDTKGSRVRASIGKRKGCSISIPWDHALDVAENHDAAAVTLAMRLGWTGELLRAGSADDSGYCYTLATAERVKIVGCNA